MHSEQIVLWKRELCSSLIYEYLQYKTTEIQDPLDQEGEITPLSEELVD